MSTQSPNKISKLIDKISSTAFTLSLFASKVQYVPAVNIAASFLNILSISLSLLGYSLWYVASYFYPDHPPKHTEWYGFAALKEQNAYAALIGMAAAVLSMIAITTPMLAIPAAWLFFTSNVIWATSEYHKLKNPPPSQEYSKSYQKSYLSYAIAITSSGLTNAVATTAILLFPLYTIPVFAITGLMNLSFNLIAIEYLLNNKFSPHPRTPVPSYKQMSSGLEGGLDHQEEALPAPYHGPSLLAKAQTIHNKDTVIELDEIELSEQDSSSCHFNC